MAKLALYKCPVCGLHYVDKQVALRCEDYCNKNQGCSLDITLLSEERSRAAVKPSNIEPKT